MSLYQNKMFPERLETKRGDFMLVQVFLYRDDEERAVTCKAAEVDPDAHR